MSRGVGGEGMGGGGGREGGYKGGAGVRGGEGGTRAGQVVAAARPMVFRIPSPAHLGVDVLSSVVGRLCARRAAS